MSTPPTIRLPKPITLHTKIPIKSNDIVIIQPSIADPLFGIPVIVEGLGYNYQYIQHTVFEKNGVKYWRITTGYVVIYALMQNDNAVAVFPVSFFGYTTPDVIDAVKRGRARYYAFIKPMKEIEAPEDTIINLQQVYNGKDIVLRIDPHGIAHKSDMELMEEYVKLQTDYMRVLEILEKLRIQNRKLESRVRIAERQVVNYEAMIGEMSVSISQYQIMLTKYEQTIEEALIKMQQMSSNIMAEKELRDKMEMYMREMTETMQSAMQAIRTMREMLSNVVEMAGVMGAGTETGTSQPTLSGTEQSQQQSQTSGGQGGGT
ncbi:MAG: hypothetical protein JHC26_07450 [Thermofilum sp.]|jgi:hypothetical protein|uniref:hypothetical protein n=1 Tax=Thermofilum sp. TaxID=1961369 RepID=UPI00258D2E80|nr:hypothetical protein [Thermofilum sp.]MCI4408912.1 hypothetical protein [Thermofilum sp.]